MMEMQVSGQQSNNGISRPPPYYQYQNHQQIRNSGKTTTVADALDASLDRNQQNSSMRGRIKEYYLIIDDGPVLRGHPEIPVYHCKNGCGGYRFSYDIADKQCRGVETCHQKRKIYVSLLMRLSPYIDRCSMCKFAFFNPEGVSEKIADSISLCGECGRARIVCDTPFPNNNQMNRASSSFDGRQVMLSTKQCEVCGANNAKAVAIRDGIPRPPLKGRRYPFLWSWYGACSDCESTLRSCMLRELLKAARWRLDTWSEDEESKKPLQEWISANAVDESHFNVNDVGKKSE